MKGSPLTPNATTSSSQQGPAQPSSLKGSPQLHGKAQRLNPMETSGSPGPAGPSSRAVQGASLASSTPDHQSCQCAPFPHRKRPSPYHSLEPQPFLETRSLFLS